MLPHNVLMCLMNRPSQNTRDMARACDELGGEARFRILTLDAMAEEGDSTIMTFNEGECYFIETLTKYWVGRIKSATATELFLTDASWIADTGLMADFIRTGRAQHLNVEPVGDWQVPVAIITGAGVWKHKLFKEPVR